MKLIHEFCTISECDKKHHAKGYCKRHYVKIIFPTIKGKPCLIDGCNKKHCGLGYCQMHYTRLKIHGDPNKVKLIWNPTRGCKVEGCNKKHCSKNYCDKHYREWFRKTYPEKSLERTIRYLKKCSKSFDMTTSMYGHAISDWRYMVKTRDKKCKICDSEEGLIAHHILYKRKYPELSLDPYNGVTLCSLCHYDYHDLNGWRQ